MVINKKYYVTKMKKVLSVIIHAIHNNSADINAKELVDLAYKELYTFRVKLFAKEFLFADMNAKGNADSHADFV